MRLFSYKMIHDTGFAPNPFFGILTLATCKPKIRENRFIGDYIAGFTSKELDNSEVGNEKLVYFMKITGKIPFSIYWKAQRFQIKKPNLESKDLRRHFGDNIYEFDSNSRKFIQHPNKCHCDKNEDTDKSSLNILFSDDFYYFGASAISLPKEVRPEVPLGESANGYETKEVERIIKLINYLETNFKKGIIDHPTTWDENDTSWMEN